MPATGTPGTPELVGTFTVRIPAETDPGTFEHLLSATADNPDVNFDNNYCATGAGPEARPMRSRAWPRSTCRSPTWPIRWTG